MGLFALLAKYQSVYYGWRRVVFHVLFWVVLFFYELVQTNLTIESSKVSLFFTFREVSTIMLLHYFLAYYAIPKLLLKFKWIRFVLSVIISYAVLMGGMYYSLLFLRENHLVNGYLEQTADFFLKYDFATTLVDPARMYNVFIFNLSLVFSLLIKITASFFRSNMQKITLEKEKIKLELDFLKAQVNPHFFFNTLNSIYSLIVDKDEVAADIVLKLSDLMRYNLYESKSNKIPLSREFQFIQDYVKLERIRHKEHVTIITDIQNVAEDSLEIPPLVLITYVENAFKHGINNTIEASWVKVSASVENDILSFVVENSKPAKLQRAAAHGGIGLVNARRRLDLLYPNHYQLTVRNEIASYSVHLTLLLHERSSQLYHRRRRAARSKRHKEVH